MHRADRARQEVTQYSGIEHPANFQNKTPCADSLLYNNKKRAGQQNLSKSKKLGRQKALLLNNISGMRSTLELKSLSALIFMKCAGPLVNVFPQDIM